MSRQALRVVAALVQRDGRVLMQQRPAHKARPGSWELPGGKVEPGEPDEAAVRREWREELGVDVRVGPRLAEHTHDYGDACIHLVVYVAELTPAAVLTAHDGQLVAWLTRAELEAAPLCAADRAVFAALTGNASLWHRDHP